LAPVSGHSPARYAAPVALVAAALAIYLIGFAGGSDNEDGKPASSPTTRTAGKAAPKKGSGASTTARGGGTPKATTGRTYTIKPGDALSVIADQTGVSIPELQRLNPGLDARALRVGRKLRLSG